MRTNSWATSISTDEWMTPVGGMHSPATAKAMAQMNEEMASRCFILGKGEMIKG